MNTSVINNLFLQAGINKYCRLKGGLHMKLAKKLLVIMTLVIILISSTVFADTIAREIKVYFRGITIDIDGEEISTDSQPFIYKDRVYVPLRFVVEGLYREIKWDDKNNKVKMKSYRDFSDYDYFDGEIFVYGLVTDLNKEEKLMTIEQHFDDNSIEINTSLKISDDVVIILKRNDKKMNLEVDDLRVGEDIGLVLDKNSLVRGIIISK